MKKKITVTNKLWPLSKLTPHPSNPRKITDYEFDQLCADIEGMPHYSKSRPIIVSDRLGKYVIIAGEQRYKAALELGLKKFHVSVHSGLTKEMEDEIMFKDNLHRGVFDMEIVYNKFDAETVTEYGLEMIIPSKKSSSSKTKKKIEVTHTCPNCGHEFR